MLYDGDAPAVCSNFVARMPVHKDHNARYLAYLHAYLYERAINVRSIKQTTGIQNLDSAAYLREKVSLPPRSEQDAIVRFLAHADHRITRSLRAKQKLLRLLDEQKQVVVHQAVTRGLKAGEHLVASGVEGFGDMPAHWTVARAKFLFQAVDVRSGTGDEELLTVSAKRGVVPRSSGSVTMFMAESYAGHKLCWPEDLVINSLWAWARGLGFSTRHGIVSTAYGVYRLRSDHRALWRYLDYALRSPAYQWQFNVRSKGIWKSRLQLTDGAFLDMPIAFPSVPEAEAIVRHIEQATADVSRALKRADREIVLLLEYRTRVIAELVTGQRDARAAAASLSDPTTYSDDDVLDADADAGSEEPELTEAAA